ncbi:mechanosensitive ion channel [Halomonas sp. KAO]|uniref:mechanosensitive ion channel domain-containing protein n=1 Tax=unclassified Halomonas TaxID=2609666 RepID=UPI00189C6F49|nr:MULTISPECIES: mechanosensitive ion channel domain-containing protein [unclassified Halomonas]MBF7053541.1 mechanosensitive ion channel [Halomonas sp. KAO]MDT0502708.1 mechanosensitive ion channel [Halomonas sp. PAR7]MDT0512557.1 mechanosensitive ion channel [Halomonas sp. LES1]MDT0592861.1 mechanosensitive ion channel [Halomonas sp. PAR8]
MNPKRALPLMLGWLLLALLMLAAPAQAQQASGSSEPPAYSTLADLLENQETRQELIDQLRGMAGDVAESTPGEAASAAPSLPRQLAELTSRVASDIGSQLEAIASAIGGMFASDLESTFDMGAFTSAAINLGLVILATFLLFIAVRRLARPLFTSISQWSLNGRGLTPILRLIICVALAAVVDVLIVSLAYLGGNLIATFAIGQTGELSTQASLFLNAFLVIELLKAGVRMLFASRYDGLRLLPISSEEASYWNRWIARLIGLVGYGLMVVVPLVTVYLSPAVGKGLGTLIMVAAFLYAVVVVLKNRKRLRDAFDAKAHQTTMAASRVSLQLFARTWHLFALAYFTMVLVLTLARPEDALPFVLFATLKSIGAVVVGLLLSSFLTQTIGRRIRLSDDLRRKLPLLEPRLNSYVPNALRVIRTLIVVLIIMVVLNAWGAFDLAAWYASEVGRNLVGKLVSVATILAIALMVWLALASLIEHKLNPDTGGGMPSARAQTLLSLFRNALAIALVTMTAMIVLAEIGINIGPLIAGAGVLGLAIGFGAQKLVQDIITGIFIQVENAMNTGDVVTVGGITGTAEKLNIRSVGIRDLSGTYHLVPFSSVDTVSNYMRGFGNHVGEYGIAYRENIDTAIEQLQLAYQDLKASDEHGHKLLAPLDVAGVTALADSSVNIRVIIKTTPGDQWAVGRAYNRLVKLRFDEAGIEIPFPHTTLYFGQDKSGTAPPANLRVMQQDFTIDGSPAGQPRGDDTATDDRFIPVRKGATTSASERINPRHEQVDPENKKPSGSDVDEP